MKIKKFSPKQKTVLNWWRNGNGKYDAIICDGAVRSGKTLSMGVSFVCWAMCSFKGERFAFCGKTITSIRRNVVDVVIPVLKSVGFSVSDSISKNVLTVSRGSVKNEFFLFGGKDEGSAALIQGITLAGVMFDETALQPRSFVEQACARCSVNGSKFWFNCNPEGPEHWFYKEWIKKAEERSALYLHFTMEDNPSLSKEIRRRYERLYSGAFYRRFVLGEWVCADGRIYDFFDESYVRPIPEGRFEQWYISCDYGTANPASFGLWGLKDGVWYRVKEYYFASREMGYQKTDEEYADEIERLAEGIDVRAVIVDPSAASFIEALKRRGFASKRAKNDVLTGIRVTADLLKSGKMVICEGCEDAVREFSLYVWEDGGVKDSPKKENDHAMDDIRYFAATVAAGYEEGFAATFVER